jgi:hypothetical protein
VGQRREVAHHHAEAVVEGDRDADPVALVVVAALADQVAVAEDVAVAQRGALRQPGGAARVRDVDRLLRGHLGLARRECRVVDLLTLLLKLLPGRVVEPDELGRQAAELVERRIGGLDAPPERIVLEPTLRVRESALGGG